MARRGVKTALALLLFASVAHADDQQLLAGPRCAHFSAAMADEAKSARPHPDIAPEILVRNMLERVKTVVPAGEWKPCSAAFERGMKAFRTKSLETEATVELDRIKKGFAAHLLDSGVVCPSTKRPAPADLARLQTGSYTASDDDWSDPAWSCVGVGNDLKAQRFQYELKTTSASIEITARGYEAQKLVTLVQKGKVSDGTITWSERIRK